MSRLFELNKNLETISLDYLYEGLVVQDDIYNHDGKLMLVAKGVTLTDAALQGLKKFNSSQQNIKVTSNVRQQLMNRGIPPKLKQENFEVKAGYSKVKAQTENLIAIAQRTSAAPYEEARDTGDLVMDRITTIEPAVLFQCINAHNEADEYLQRHSSNVAILNGLMGKWLGLNDKGISDLVLLGLMHDIGKTKVPQDILNSPGKLTEEEFAIVKRHSIYSHEMLGVSGRFSESVQAGARHHHERMNGTGYPDRLMTDSIPFYSRITAISDIYDAMVSQRCYKNAQSPFKILLQMENDKFWGLDIKLVKIFQEQMPQELIGKSVLLSDGRAGIVKHINDSNLEYPLVEVNGEVVLTNNDLYCVSMIID